jgi:hypothetical protein
MKKGEQSKFHKYFNILPKKFPCPLNYNEQEMAMLVNTSIPRFIKGVRGEIELCYNENQAIKDNVTLDELMHVNSMILSRKFNLSSETITDCMVPFADMANHSDDNNIAYSYSWPHRGVVYRALRNIKRGEEITISYGKTKPNDVIFFQYAFTLGGEDHSIWDAV